jgi:hypothetical protein
MRSSYETWRDRLAQRIAGLLPRRVQYWAYIRIAASATAAPEFATREVPGIGITEVLPLLRRGFP